MSKKYIDVDRLQAETTLEQAAAKCGVELDVRQTGKEARIDCPFGCTGDHAGRKEVAVNTEHPQKVLYCHAYQCGFTPGSERPFIVTPGALGRFTRDEVVACLHILQTVAWESGGLDYVQVFESSFPH